MKITFALLLTYSRIVLTPIFMLLVLSNFPGARIWAITVFIIASLTDLLDGYIARITNSVTTLGAIMDPIADKFLVTSALVVLVEKGLLSSWIVVIIIFREFFISGLRIFASQQHINVSAHFMGKLKTVIQMVMIVSVLAQYQYAWIFVYTTLFLTVYSGIEYTIKYTYYLRTDSIYDRTKRVHKLLTERNLTISVCESCTGGLLGSYLSRLSGSSLFFKGGIISYMTEVKRGILNIDEDIIKEKGVVSKEVAYLMAKRTKDIFKSDMSISITGLAGPTKGSGKDADKPIGLVYIGFAYGENILVERFLFSGDRETVRIKSCESALRIIEENIKEGGNWA